MKKILLILFVAILLVGTVSAFEFDNVKNYDPKTKTIEIRNSILGIPFLQLDKIAEIQLKTPLEYEVPRGYQKVAEFELYNFEKDYINAFKDMNFYQINNNLEEFQRDFDYKYLDYVNEEQVVYGEVCGNKYVNGTLQEVCETKEVDKKIVQVPIWIKFNDINELPSNQDNFTIGIFTIVEKGDKVEWVPTFFGVKINEWAVWTESLNVDLMVYHKLDETSGLVVDAYGDNDGVNVGATRGVAGKIVNAFDFESGETDSVNLSIVPDYPDFTTCLWVNLETNSSTGQSMFNYDENGVTYGYKVLLFGSGNIRAGVGSSLTTYPYSGTDEWLFVCMVRDSSEGTGLLYVNGTNVENMTLGTSTSGAGPPIARLGVTWEENDYLDGLLDEVGVWNRSLNAEEISDLWNDGNGLVFRGGLSITLNSPIDNYNSTNRMVVFNGSVHDTQGDDVENVSLYIDGVLNETNSSGINNTNYIFTKTLSYGDHNWTYEACSNVSLCTSAKVRDLTVASFFVDLITYNSSSYETAQETFIINITTNGTQTTSAEFFYGGISQGTSTKIGTDSNANFSNTIQIPIFTGNKTFLWQITLGTTKENTTAINQTVNLIQLGLCNATLTVPYINFSFKDEETSSVLNATIDSSTWSYWLGDGTVTKSLLYSNTTENFNYAFCLNPGNKTLHNTRSIQYAKSGYPQRKYDSSGDLTNSTTNKTLYLLSSADGIYSSIQVVDQDGDRVSGVEITAERQFSGVWTIIGQETTDDAGSVTFWLNPDYDHKFTFVSDDCVGTTATIRPTQTQYTQQLQCDGTGVDFVSQLEGIKYSRSPQEGIIQVGTYNFTYQIVSSKDNIVNASFQLVNTSNRAVLNSTSSTCAPGGCTLSFLYTVGIGDDFKGKYYVDVGNGSILLEGDAHWVNVPIDTEGKSGLKTLVQDWIYVFQEWGDDSNTDDFNRLVAIFFLLSIVIAFLNYQFQIDTLNPGAFMIVLTVVIFMGSLVGGTTGQGFFYFNNLSTVPFINNYLLAFICLLISGSYFLNINRQAQR